MAAEKPEMSGCNCERIERQELEIASTDNFFRDFYWKGKRNRELTGEVDSLKLEINSKARTQLKTS